MRELGDLEESEENVVVEQVVQDQVGIFAEKVLHVQEHVIHIDARNRLLQHALIQTMN